MSTLRIILVSVRIHTNEFRAFPGRLSTVVMDYETFSMDFELEVWIRLLHITSPLNEILFLYQTSAVLSAN